MTTEQLQAEQYHTTKSLLEDFFPQLMNHKNFES